MKVLTLISTVVGLAAQAYAIEPPAPYVSALPSQSPTIELPGVYKPQIQGAQGYAGFDTSRVCGNSSLSGGDRLRCERDMNQAASEAARADVRRKYDAGIATPPPEVAPRRPSAASQENETEARPGSADKEQKEAAPNGESNGATQ
jgi:hypothetical protein